LRQASRSPAGTSRRPIQASISRRVEADHALLTDLQQGTPDQQRIVPHQRQGGRLVEFLGHDLARLERGRRTVEPLATGRPARKSSRARCGPELLAQVACDHQLVTGGDQQAFWRALPAQPAFS
jgi:hypothetical protein